MLWLFQRQKFRGVVDVDWANVIDFNQGHFNQWCSQGVNEINQGLFLFISLIEINQSCD